MLNLMREHPDPWIGWIPAEVYAACCAGMTKFELLEAAFNLIHKPAIVPLLAR